MNEKIATLLARAKITTKVSDVSKLHGDASYRVYYRASLADGKTVIAMQMPDGKSSVSEEITNFKGRHNEIPFINIQRFLSSLGLPVPQIISWDENMRLMILEDLGDEMLFRTLETADGPTRVKWYKKAVDLLCELQAKTCGRTKDDSIALQRSFDPTLLDWEFDHFREYLIEERLGKKMLAADRELFERVTRAITKKIEKIPYCFVHRDFQSKNLIIKNNGSLSLIDFQDALMGPFVYDLVALLRDSYIELNWPQVTELLEYYQHKTKALKIVEAQGFNVVQTPIVDLFNLVTLQRKMKDAGRFVFIDRVKKNPNFLQYIPATLRYIKQALTVAKANDHDISELFEMLKKYVPEFAS